MWCHWNTNVPRCRMSANISHWLPLHTEAAANILHQSRAQLRNPFHLKPSSVPVQEEGPWSLSEVEIQWCSKIADRPTTELQNDFLEWGCWRNMRKRLLILATCTQTTTKPNSIAYGEAEDDTEIKMHTRWKVCPRTVWRNYPSTARITV